jgi:NodT family efflux transporter outer membrane factor (OMF) lipoprotein
MSRIQSMYAAASLAAALAVAGLLAACEVGPDYVKPSAPTPAAYKEERGWKPSQPQQAMSWQSWWLIYGDPLLDDLEKQVDVSNQNLKAAEAAYRESRAAVVVARSAFFPTVSFTGAATRSGAGAGGGSNGVTAVPGGIAVSRGPTASNLFNVGLGATWEPDIWGKVARAVESDVALAQMSAADYAAARLSAQASLAADYFELRAEDELKRLLDDTVTAYKKSLEITRNQYEAGFAAKSDMVTAETLVRTTEAQAIGVGVQRAQLEHAIAVLIGKPPEALSIAPDSLPNAIPSPPTGLPSALLERNPTIAAAERQMASANAQIGVAVAAFYPDVTLTASYGFESSMISNLMQTPSSYWSFGPAVDQTLFDAGARAGAVQEARAAYDQQVADYRQAVLTGFQQVEDQLAALRILEQEGTVENDAVKLSREAVQLILNQYRAGTVAFTAVVTDQAIQLSDEQTALTIKQDRFVASVSLIEALGGGWDESQLPSTLQVETQVPIPGIANPPDKDTPGWDVSTWFLSILP